VNCIRLCGWNPGTQRIRAAQAIVMSRYLVRRYIEQYGIPDVIHAQSTLWGGVAGLEASRKYNVPLVITEHASPILRGSWSAWEVTAARKALMGATVVLAVSGALCAALRRLVPSLEVHVVPNVVDIEFFSLSETRGKQPDYTFLAVGELVPVKAFDLAIRAFSAAFSSDPAVRFRIVGAGSHEAVVRRAISELRLTDRVTMVGPLTRPEVRAAMWAADALIVSSRVETFSVVVVEAHATGLPVIATRSGGPDDLVTADNGILVSPGSASELSRAMRTMYADRLSWWARAAKIRESAFPFDSRRVADQIIDHYSAALSS
jgi:glycosyltransferase involved in cell wall biosynthesis